MITQKIINLFKQREFISVASADFEGRPNVAPKFLLKIEDNFVYLVDHVVGRTFQNLKINPRVSISVMDADTLKGYQINGSVETIEKGELYDNILGELKNKQISLATERIIKGVQQGRRHEGFEMDFPERIAVFKVRIEEVIVIDSTGKLQRERVEEE
jgi:uncharacterized pyridoxamine 5'-phosphate oxidase family protein